MLFCWDDVLMVSCFDNDGVISLAHSCGSHTHAMTLPPPCLIHDTCYFLSPYSSLPIILIQVCFGFICVETDSKTTEAFLDDNLVFLFSNVTSSLLLVVHLKVGLDCWI